MEKAYITLTEEVVNAHNHRMHISRTRSDWKDQYKKIRLILLQNIYIISALISY